MVRANRLVSTALGLTLEADDAGSTNLRRLPGESVTPARFLEIAVRLSRIVASVHQRGISHRDINPANIIFDRASGELTLIDFGLASRIKREATDVRALGMLEGTIGYLSPEQTGRMNRSVDRRTDLYSLGVTFYELLAGRLPFAAADPLALLHATVAVVPPKVTDVRDDVPEPIADIIARLLEKDAERRYQHAAALADDLDRCQRVLGTRGHIEPFDLGETDRRATFFIPERLYGRDAEVAALQGAFQRACAGQTTFLGVKGPAGIGKTALVRELLPCIAAGGLLVSGVCNPVQRTPYAPIVGVLREIAASVLAGSEESVAFHKARYERAVEGEGGATFVYSS